MSALLGPTEIIDAVEIHVRRTGHLDYGDGWVPPWVRMTEIVAGQERAAGWLDWHYICGECGWHCNAWQSGGGGGRDE